MSENDKRITRDGTPQGDGAERVMLSAVGGADYIRTKIQTNADGSDTMLRTRGGAPEFTTTNPEKPELEILPTTFIGIPVSQAHQAGYNPVTNPVKLVHEWVRRDGSTPPPEAHTSQSSPKFAAKYEYDVDKIPGQHTWYSLGIKLERRPLIVSWKGPMWRCGNYAAFKAAGMNGDIAVFAPLGATVYSGTASVPGKVYSNTTGSVETLFSLTREGFASAVWLNGVHIQTSSQVWSAAVKKKTANDPYDYLYYISDHTVHRRKVRYKERRRGVQVVPAEPVSEANPETTVVTFNPSSHIDAMYPERFGYNLVQMPFINASCTKAVFLYAVESESESVAMVLLEGDFSTGAMAEIKHTHYVFSGSTYVGTVSGPGELGDGYGTMNTNWSTSLAGSMSKTPGISHIVSPMAADYVGDALEYLYMESSHGYPGMQGSWSDTGTATQTGSITGGVELQTTVWNYSFSVSFTSSGGATAPSALPSPSGVRLMSHLYGQVALLSVPVDTSSTWTHSASCSSSGGYTRVHSNFVLVSDDSSGMSGQSVSVGVGEIATESTSMGWERASLLDGDLRSRCYSFVMAFATQESFSSVSVSPSPYNVMANVGQPGVQWYFENTFPMVTYATYKMVARYASRVFAFGAEVFASDTSHEYYTQGGAGEPEAVAGSFWGPKNFGTATQVIPAEDRPAYMPPLHSTPQFTQQETIQGSATYKLDAPKFTGVAVSAPKTVDGSQTAYISVNFPDRAGQTGQSFHAFIKKTKDGVSAHPCGGIAYAPDSTNRTIARPLFLPTRLPK